MTLVVYIQLIVLLASLITAHRQINIQEVTSVRDMLWGYASSRHID